MGFKRVKKENVGNVSGKKKLSKLSRNFFILGVLIVAVVFVNTWVYISNNQDIEIVKLKESIPQDGIITQDHFYKDTMSKKEYNKQGIIEVYAGFKRRAIVLWEDRNTIETAYASYYIRKDTPLYWDALTTEQPKDYAYLYQMDGELLRLDIDPEEFGNILVPGDKLNIRISYDEQDYTLLNDSEYSALIASGGVQAKTVRVEKMLFSGVTVLDMLNSDGDSIFDMYYLLLNYNTKQQEEFMNSPEFIEKTTPVKVLLNVTAEEAEAYMRVKGKSPQMMVTLLPRESGNVITEALADLGIK